MLIRHRQDMVTELDCAKNQRARTTVDRHSDQQGRIPPLFGCVDLSIHGLSNFRKPGPRRFLIRRTNENNSKSAFDCQRLFHYVTVQFL